MGQLIVAKLNKMLDLSSKTIGNPMAFFIFVKMSDSSYLCVSMAVTVGRSRENGNFLGSFLSQKRFLSMLYKTT